MRITVFINLHYAAVFNILTGLKIYSKQVISVYFKHIKQEIVPEPGGVGRYSGYSKICKLFLVDVLL